MNQLIRPYRTLEHPLDTVTNQLPQFQDHFFPDQEYLTEGGQATIKVATLHLPSTGQKAAIKWLKNELRQPTRIARHLREAQILHTLQASKYTPNLIGLVTDATRTQIGIVMELLASHQTLNETLGSLGGTDYFENFDPTATLIRQVCEALLDLETSRIVHRDIKPSNIMISLNPQAGLDTKLIDFGIALINATTPQIQAHATDQNVIVADHITQLSLTADGMTIGTPQYMSPEQISSAPLDTRSDIYTFGCTIYYLTHGHPPFDGATYLQIVNQHLDDIIPMMIADLDPTISDIIFRMMSSRINRRPQSPTAIIQALDQRAHELPAYEVPLYLGHLEQLSPSRPLELSTT
jgi:serine/threonine-protein kinase